ncbi:MAG: hypothetical protein Q8R34_02250 [bacterium]|nr:hypothetical protein [bacterium]
MAKPKKKIIKPRAPVQKIKSEQIHKSLKDYNRAQSKKELGEILKEVKKPNN